jgi:SAM-dependent methyltransferase
MVLASRDHWAIDMPLSDILQKKGIEIGGPSPDIFGAGGAFPIYPRIASLDNVNFSSKTTWEGSILEGKTFSFDLSRPLGLQYILEMTALVNIPSATYDFLLSSHTLEHAANPILALREWVRVLTDDGVIILVIPHKDGTFDWRRPTTTIDHLKDDFDRRVDEQDLSHLPEILELHDLSRDPGAGDFANFKARSLKNFENRCLHHHTFTTLSAVTLLDYVGVGIVSVQAFRPCHIVVVAQKGQDVNNSYFLIPSSPCYRMSPFHSDRVRNPGGLLVGGSRSIKRNDSCPCGSGKKFKHCHGRS